MKKDESKTRPKSNVSAKDSAAYKMASALLNVAKGRGLTK